ncbi:bromodomain protein-2 [Diaporthe helianthi]|uniref:Bromodomain protein-2 n=1 Tax=Diaporthe helianthi TaxID=158607 RepID=A0A2P5I5Q0_DIAHE|nr:bromodomain protein-2 [Diaporthe helianthi]
MSLHQSQNGWPTPAGSQGNGISMNQPLSDGSSRSQIDAHLLMPEASDNHDDDHRRAHFAHLFRKTDARIAALFSDDGEIHPAAVESLKRPPTADDSFNLPPPTTDHSPVQQPPLKKAKRVIDEDDYGDDDEDEDEQEEHNADGGSAPLKSQTAANAAAAKTYLSPSKSGSSPVHSVSSPGKNGDKSKEDSASQDQARSSEDARRQLEQARNATEEAAKRSFHTLFYTLENDRTAMLEQQQLEESEKQIQAEMDKNGGSASNEGPGQAHGSLSSANLGASSLTLKHLIARIDMKRSQVQATDQELRSLMNEVRKNRSKWASEDNVGQEELYEALEKVLSELKAHTEYSTPFLQKVSKRDAPDYYSVIKQPMDLGTMTKKLKQLQYKSKADFVADLSLIWDNCLRYNQNLNNHLPRMANGMRREADKLTPLIPDLVIRPRAEVEAEERRKQNGGEDDAGEDSDDEPIISSRGRSSATKGATKSRKAPSDQKEGTPNNDSKPILQLNGILAKTGREGSEMGEGSNGFGTPPVGSFTPLGQHGQSGIGSNADAMDIDGPSLSGMALDHALGEAADQEVEDEEYKIWKQVTKKDRALAARERHKLFKGNKLNIDEPALLRTKAGMRRVLRSQNQAELSGTLAASGGDSAAITTKDAAKPIESLAEGMEDEEERAVPDYYETNQLVPDVPPKLQWIEDDEGQVINQHEDVLRMVPRGSFVAPPSILTKKFDANLRQLQETRKVVSKIGVIKQMQIQSQVYANQFPKYEPEPFVEADIEPHFVAGDAPVVAPHVCKSALQRSVAKIFYHAGFEELQPSALDVVGDIAADYFEKLIRTFNVYQQAEKKTATGVYAERGAKFQPRFTQEEVILHTLNESGHSLETLEGYAKDDVERLGTKLGTMHERMKSHLADLLRPALNDVGPDGAGAFRDGSDQFVGGDFAEELGEDFFGFKALGLDLELGLEVLSVPLHLLQTRVRNTFQSQAQTVDAETHDVFEQLPPAEPVTKDNIQDQIGLVKNFFLAKLHANGDQPLVEDEDLPVKQRRPRPRLGATGKIVSPQKRPPKEQIALAKKKKKLEAGKAQVTDPKPGGPNTTPEKGKKLGKNVPALPNGAPNPLQAPSMERVDSLQSQGVASSPPGDVKDEAVGMLSPESNEQ